MTLGFQDNAQMNDAIARVNRIKKNPTVTHDE
jgi:hypothetical protein